MRKRGAKAVGFRTLSFNPGIHRLRGVAVLAVVAYHYFPDFLPGGFTGVDIFFVISGYLITRWILQRGALSPRKLLQEFFLSRILRLAPALFLMVAVMYVFALATFLPSELRFLGKHGTAGLLGAANLSLWSETGYFDQDSMRKPFLHLWSLGVEDQFYFLWPLLILLVIGVSKFFCTRVNVALFVALFALGVSSFAVGIWLTESFPAAGFYFLPARAWELIAGGLLGLVFATGFRGPIQRIPSFIWKIVAVGLICLSVLIIEDVASYPGTLALIPVLGSLAWIVGSELSSSHPRWQGWGVTSYFGSISYALYLWHWPILSVGYVLLGPRFEGPTIVIALLIALTLSTASTFMVEKPFRSRKWPAATKFVLPISWLALIAISLVFYFTNGIPSRITEEGRKANDQIQNASWEYRQNSLCGQAFYFEPADSYPWWFCFLEEDREPTVALIGSSVMNQLTPGFINAEKLKYQNFLSIGTCGALMDPDLFIDFPTPNPCTSDRRKEQNTFFQEMLAVHNFPFVFVEGSPQTLSEIEPAIRRLGDYSLYVENVVIVKYWKIPPFSPEDCLLRPFRVGFRETCSIALEYWDDSESVWLEFEREVRERFPDVRIFDPNAAYCDEHSCNYLDRGVPVMRDAVHLSLHGSEMVALEFVDWAKVNLPQILGP